jgi:hypothetical protein
MSILTLLITLIVVGVVLWLVNKYIPMDRKIKTILNALVVILVILWLDFYSLKKQFLNYQRVTRLARA